MCHTSGKPKGVLIDHGAFAQALCNIPAYEGFGPGCCFGQVSSPAYSGHVNDIWMPLTKGAAVGIIPKEVMLEPMKFAEMLGKLQINAVILPPKALEFYSQVSPHVLSVLRLIQFAGEKVNLHAVLKLLRALPAGALLQHLYGCFEHCTIVSCLEIEASEQAAEKLQEQMAAFSRLPAGQPRHDVKVYILDPETLEEMPEGEEGEVYLCGQQLAIGYHMKPGVTAENFTTLPKTGERVYRTGDLGRMAPHGLGLDILGRARDDGMTTINGFRVELGKIESAAINATDLGVETAVATLYQQKMLVLYVTPEVVDTDALMERLKSKLAYYMGPTYIETLCMMPLTAAGKIDRQALPDLMAAMQKAVDPSISVKQIEKGGTEKPPTELEQTIMDMFADVLEIPRASLTPVSSFSGLGGYSLMGNHLKEMMREKLDCASLCLSDLLEDDCPRFLAELVEKIRAEGSGAHDDGVIKINGFRIKLGEIESHAINATDLGVETAVATLSQQDKLVLYVTPDYIDSDALMERLKSKLAYYMVPTCIETLIQLPLTTDGNIDHKALPDSKAAIQKAVTHSISVKQIKQGGMEKPPTELEQTIMDMFADVLKIPRACLTPVSSFSGLGGISLDLNMLAQMMTAGLDCPFLQVSDLLEDDCPRFLAEVVEKIRAEGSGALHEGENDQVPFSATNVEIVRLRPGNNPVLHGRRAQFACVRHHE